MANTKRKNNPIALELKEFKDKIDEFQSYLKLNKIKNISDYHEKHDEIKIQILLMKELPAMLREHKDLLIMEEEQKEKDNIRGDVELSPIESGLV